MKKLFKIFAITLVGSLLFGACDKIEENEYVVFGGAAGTWYDGDGVADHSQRAFLEKYTGVRCTNCPKADEAIATAQAAYNGKLIAVAIHDSSVFTTPFVDSPDLRTDDGDAWSKALGVFSAGSYPAAIVSRTPATTGWDLFTPTSGIESRVDTIVNQPASIAIAVESKLEEGAVTIGVDLEFLQDVDGELTLTLLLMEDGIVATQVQPDGTRQTDYTHNHVLRDVITDLWGLDVEADGQTGTARFVQVKYDRYDEDWDLTKCHVIAFVSDKATKRVLNVAECEVQ